MFLTLAGHVIPAGVHHYNFRLALPYRLPSSYRGRWGSIQYSVKAHLERNGKSTIENEIEFTVMDVIDLNNTPELAVNNLSAHMDVKEVKVSIF